MTDISQVPFDIFVRKYEDETPICTLTVGKVSNTDDLHEDHCGGDEDQDKLEDEVASSLNSEEMQDLNERCSHKNEITLHDLKMMIYE